MEILTPPRIESLGSQAVHIVEHADGKTSAWTLSDVYPFDTVLMIKQRIALHHEGSRAWLPQHQFVAVADEGLWRPLEFVWSFGPLADPLAKRGAVDARLLEGNVRKAIFPQITDGVTLETFAVTGEPEIHVWTLEALAKDLKITTQIFGAYLQLYFPALRTEADVEAALADAPLSAQEQDVFETLRSFHTLRGDRLVALNGRLGELTATTPLQLQHLHVLRIVLPKKALEEDLAILFYALPLTRARPLLRFFSGQKRTPPLLKLATGPTGVPLITDTRLLEALMADAPSVENGAVLVAKAPLPRAPVGAAVTLRIYQDGSGEIVLGTPRRDMPLTPTMVEEAFRALPDFLLGTPWSWEKDGAGADIAELTAHYQFNLQKDVRKPTREELKKRAVPLQPLFDLEPAIAGDSAALHLRWKVVSNYTADRGDPVMRYITQIYMRDTAQSLEALPVKNYVAALTREFGIAPTEAAAVLSRWLDRRAEYILLDPEDPSKKVAPAHNLGAAAALYNFHPKYSFQVTAVESRVDLARLLTMLEVLVSYTAKELNPADVAAVTAVALEEAVAPEDVAPPVLEEAPAYNAEQMEEWAAMMNMYAMGAEEGDVGNADAVVTDAQNLAAQAQPVQQAPQQPLEEPTNIRFPEPLRNAEEPLGSTKEYYLQQLKQRNVNLFQYKEEKGTAAKLYSRSCQNNVSKQPNIMSPESYRRIRAIYADRVHWLEGPLTGAAAEAVFIASKNSGERMKVGPTELGKSLADVVALERKALSLGYPLKDGKSILAAWKDGPGMDEDMRRLQAFQASKPLWIVVRAGTVAGQPNYYICAEFWCVRDDLPITEEGFVGTTAFSGTGTKAANSCPFCGGRLIQNRDAPAQGETVIRRGPSTAGSGPVAKFVGYLKGLFHPKQYALPCCFVDPNNMVPPEGSQAIPAPVVPLPRAQVEAEANVGEAAEAPVEEDAVAAGPTTSPLMSIFRPMKLKMDYKEAAFRFLTGNPAAADKYKIVDGRKKIEINARRIVRTYVLEDSSFPLDLGKVGILPAAVDAFLGQDRRTYLDGRLGEINTHPSISATAFFRLGFGVKPRNAGAAVLTLAAYVRASIGHLFDVKNPPVMTPEEVAEDMFGAQEVAAFHAFQQANYGSLPLEFADSDRHVSDAALQTWCGRMGIPLPQQRTYALEIYRAWLNFQDYVRDMSAPKELRLWEHLLAAPGLFSMTGVLLAVITQDTKGAVSIRCPTFGVSARDQYMNTPVLLLYEDAKTRLYEPLVLYSGPDQIMGVLYPGVFAQLPPPVRDALSAFYSEFKSAKAGCGRPAPPPYPWIPDIAPHASLVRLRTVLERLRAVSMTPIALLRDRTRRLVGVKAAGPANTEFFIPAVDDGTIDVGLPSLYDYAAVPQPPMAALLAVLATLTEGGLKELAPTTVLLRQVGDEVQQVAIQTKGGFVLAVEPLRLSAAVQHPSYASLVKRDILDGRLPWEYDMGILRPVAARDQKTVRVLAANPEEALEEAYQHLRLTFSKWLSAKGSATIRRQVEALRAARNRLPLFELRKRGEFMLAPVVGRWIHEKVVAGKQTTTTSLLRRDCLAISDKSECGGACAWVGEQCLIHAMPTERFVNPTFVLTARLVDELLRTHGDAQQIFDQKVARLRTPDGVMRSEDGLVVAAEGKGSPDLFREMGLVGRLPTSYTRGKVVPEELGREDVGYVATRRGIPLTWEGLVPMVWRPELARDLRGQMEIFWTAFAGREVPEVYRGLTDDVLQALATARGVHILTTVDGSEGFELQKWFAPAKSSDPKKVLILNPESIPLVLESTLEPVVSEKALPHAILAWMDSAYPEGAERPAEVPKKPRTPTPPSSLPPDEPSPPPAYTQIALDKERDVVRAAVLAAEGRPKPKPKGECPEGFERIPQFKKCVKKCEEGEERHETTGRCRKTRKVKRVPAVAKPEEAKAEEAKAEEKHEEPPQPKPKPEKKPKECPEGQEYVPGSKRGCLVKCKDSQQRNPETNKCENKPKPKIQDAEEKKPAEKKPKACPEGQEFVAGSKRGCLPICKDGLVRNPETNRCENPKRKKKPVKPAKPAMVIEEEEPEPEEEEPEEEEVEEEEPEEEEEEEPEEEDE